MNDEITLEVWGDFACFTPPYAKVERLTYPVPTPSALRGLLSSIYCKPVEFVWMIKRIEVLNPIKYLTFTRNEVKSKITGNKKIEVLDVEEDRTQRQTQVLKDVRYRITAKICPQKGYKGTIQQLYEQAKRRIKYGKAFCQPSLGMREFVCYFEESDGLRKPINESMDLGWMLYDVFDLYDSTVSEKEVKYKLSLYHAVMNNGIIEVPPYDSDEVLKVGDEKC